MHLSFFLYGQFVPKFVSRRQSSQLGVSTQLWGVSFIWCRVKIDYRSLSCTRIDRIPLSSESLSRQSTQSTVLVHTAVPGDLLAMGKNTQRSVSYGKNYSEGVPQDLVTAVATAVASGTAVPVHPAARGPYI